MRNCIFLIADEVEEIREQLVQLKSKADQAALSQREKEIELEALQKYFKSSEVELHRYVQLRYYIFSDIYTLKVPSFDIWTTKELLWSGVVTLLRFVTWLNLFRHLVDQSNQSAAYKHWAYTSS